MLNLTWASGGRFRIGLGLAASTMIAAAALADTSVRIRPGHPRLLLTDDGLAAAVTAAKAEPLRGALHARIIAAAEQNLTAAPLQNRRPGEDLLEQARTAVRQIVTGAMAYRLTHDARFFERARGDLLAAAAFPDWNPAHFLDVAEMSFALAVGYDWLYPQLSASDRATIARALREKSLAFATAAYAPGGPADSRLWWATAMTNWNQVCNAGFLSAALALAEDEPALAQSVIAGVRSSLPRALAAYDPDGGFPEGPGYWAYGTTYTAIALTELDVACGTDFGLGSAPGLDRTAAYRQAVQSPTGEVFNYADSADTVQNSPAYAWLAARYPNPSALAESRAWLESSIASRKISNRFFALHAIWFPPAASASMPPPLDAHFRGLADIALLRGSWTDARALFVGFKAGTNATSIHHAHLDLGSFVLDADGVRWAVDLGPDNYNLPGYFDTARQRWTYFRTTNLSHNTVTPGTALQARDAVAPITAFHSAPEHAFAIADLAPAYPGTARVLRRGIALLDRSRVLVQDEFQPTRPGVPLHWTMLTRAHIGFDADGRTATLTQKEHTLRIALLGPGNARFHLGSARPPTASEDQNENVSMLAVDVAAESPDQVLRLAVLLTPVGNPWPQLPAPTLAPLDQWR